MDIRCRQLISYIKNNDNKINIGLLLKNIDIKDDDIEHDWNIIILNYLCKYSNIKIINIWIDKLYSGNNLDKLNINKYIKVRFHDQCPDKYFFTNALLSNNYSTILYLCYKFKLSFWTLLSNSLSVDYYQTPITLTEFINKDTSILKNTIFKMPIINVNYYNLSRIIDHFVKYDILEKDFYEFIFHDFNDTNAKYQYILSLVKNKKYRLCKKIFTEQRDYLKSLHHLEFPMKKCMTYLFKDVSTHKGNHYNNSNNIVGIFCILVKFYKEIGTDLNNLINTEIILRAATLANSKKAFKYIKTSVHQLHEYIDYNNYTAIIDCARYGYFDTFKYLFHQFNNTKFNTTSCYLTLNILSASFYNNDLRIIKYIFENYSPQLEINIVDCLNSINKASNTTYHHLILKKIIILDTYVNIDKYFLYILLSIEAVTQNKEICCSIIDYYKNKILFNINSDKRIPDATIYNSPINYDSFSVSNLYQPFEDKLDFVLKLNKRLGNCNNKFCLNLLSKTNYNLDLSWKNLKITLNNIVDNNNLCEEFRNHYYSLISNATNFERLTYINNYLKSKNIYESIMNFTCINYNFSFFAKETLYKLFIGGFPFEQIKDELNISNYGKQLKRVRLILKRAINKKFNRAKSNFQFKIDQVNEELIFNPIKINNQLSINSNPVHLEKQHILNESFLNSGNIILSEKGDGIKKIITNSMVYPPIKTPCKIHCEYIESLDIHLVYDIDILDKSLDYCKEEKYKFLINNHSLSELEMVNELEIESISDLLKYRDTIKPLFDTFIKSKPKDKVCWWPKTIFKLKLIKQSLLNFLTYIIDLELDLFPTDGWILDLNRCTYKLKPLKHLTIDLLLKDNKWFDYERNSYTIIKYNDILYEDNYIYRCYYENNQWIAKNLREEKRFPNNKNIVRIVKDLVKTKFEPNNLNKYVELPYYKKFQFNKNKTHNLVSKILKDGADKQKTILDIGCGYNYFYNREVISHYKTYKGLDLDYNIFNKFLEVAPNNFILKDMNDLWEIDEPVDIILINNSIHNAIQNNTINPYFIHQLEGVASSHCELYITICDLDLLKILLNKIDNDIIRDNENYVKLNNNDTISYYYSWAHDFPITEPIISSKNLIRLLSVKFEFKKYINNSFRNVSLWNKYLNCFQTLMFKYKIE